MRKRGCVTLRVTVAAVSEGTVCEKVSEEAESKARGPKMTTRERS